MDQYKEYLATNVLNEGRPVNYRLLSRALGVHVNLAKQMLYDFHKTQNAKKSGSVHATFLVSGSKRPVAIQTNGTNGAHQDGEIPSSSPYQSSLPDADDEPARQTIKETLIMLAREEDFEDAKSRYEEITALHVYSLEAGPLKSLNLLSDCNREVCEKLATIEDPAEALRQYGAIHNPHVKRRTGRNHPKPNRPTPAAANKSAPRPSIPAKAKAEPETESKATQSKQKESDPQAHASAGPGKKKDSKQPPMKRETSNLFSSFSKAKPKKTPTAEATPTPPVDEPMLSESEGEEAEDVVSTNKSKDNGEAQEAKAEADREKEQRDKVLRDMMDESEDEVMDDAPASAEEEPQDVPIDKPKPEEKQEDTVTVTGGRRRGKRRVMKKKTVKDEEGFLVTKEEAVWESFSEDEPAPKKPRLPSATSKGKKGGAKQGQGSIMSFFSKK
ncbi:DNA polymerase subunit Cdc27 [Phyllosticta citrichinensis]|uniref:DNA polymerase delta subunit 3 n=1 Tax=Phyllosticta citrichinensis TaxID=1130410 RepID=A0ABR1XP19_9PEZI